MTDPFSPARGGLTTTTVGGSRSAAMTARAFRASARMKKQLRTPFSDAFRSAFLTESGCDSTPRTSFAIFAARIEIVPVPEYRSRTRSSAWSSAASSTAAQRRRVSLRGHQVDHHLSGQLSLPNRKIAEEAEMRPDVVRLEPGPRTAVADEGDQLVRERRLEMAFPQVEHILVRALGVKAEGQGSVRIPAEGELHLVPV